MHYDYDYDNDKKQDTKSVPKSSGRLHCEKLSTQCHRICVEHHKLCSWHQLVWSQKGLGGNYGNFVPLVPLLLYHTTTKLGLTTSN